MTINKPLVSLFFLFTLVNMAMLFDLKTGGMQSHLPGAEYLPPKDNADTKQYRLTRLESRFDALSAEFAGLSQSLQHLSQTFQANNNPQERPTSRRKEAPQRTAGTAAGQTQVFADSIEAVFELGVLNENAWQSMEQDIAAMSKAESKVFWQTVTAKIAQDEFVVTDAEP